MTDFHDYFGLYYFIGLVLDVNLREESLVAAIPGVPVGYEILLKPVGDDQFRNIGGPIDGSTLTFIRDKVGEVIGMKVDTIELVKIFPEDLHMLPVIERFPPPKFDLTPDKQVHFEKILGDSLAQANGDWIDYDLPYPKHEFVQFATAQDQIIFHGSNNLKIDEFQPIRKSTELYDHTGRGNVQGVYGTHDGLWSMFFAIIDREKLHGSINNGVMYFQNRVGRQISVYNFSINQDQLAARPYIEGALYFLPRQNFVRLMLTQESYANEWVSEQPVKPIAKLKLKPEDFPFLAQIDGHDDGELIRMNNMSSQIREAAVAADLKGDRFQVTIPQDTNIAASLDEYIALQRIFMPAAQFKVQTIDHKNVILTIISLPPAVIQVLNDQYQDLLN